MQTDVNIRNTNTTRGQFLETLMENRDLPKMMVDRHVRRSEKKKKNTTTTTTTCYKILKSSIVTKVVTRMTFHALDLPSRG